MTDGLLTVPSEDRIVVIDRYTGEVKNSIPVQDVLRAIARPDGSVLLGDGESNYRIVGLEGNALASHSWSVRSTAQTSFNDRQVSIIDPETTEGSTLDLDSGVHTTLDLRRNGGRFIAETVYPEDDGFGASRVMGLLPDSGTAGSWRRWIWADEF